ncbi:MAG: hypothetical protein IJ019_05595 [Alphaproteobacteria bacterium]|nr:hypothetical protein [Alphaproteobacteria bacterium]
MKTLEIINCVALICVALCALVEFIFFMIRAYKLDNAKTFEDLNKIFDLDGKFLRIIVAITMLLASVIILTGTLLMHPQFCAMQVIGVVLSGLWLLFAVVYIVMAIKKK